MDSSTLKVSEEIHLRTLESSIERTKTMWLRDRKGLPFSNRRSQRSQAKEHWVDEGSICCSQEFKTGWERGDEEEKKKDMRRVHVCVCVCVRDRSKAFGHSF